MVINTRHIKLNYEYKMNIVSFLLSKNENCKCQKIIKC